MQKNVSPSLQIVAEFQRGNIRNEDTVLVIFLVITTVILLVAAALFVGRFLVLLLSRPTRSCFSLEEKIQITLKHSVRFPFLVRAPVRHRIKNSIHISIEMQQNSIRSTHSFPFIL